MRILAAIAATTLLFTPAAYAAGEKDQDYYRQLELFGDVFERVRADYVKKVSEEKLIESALNGMLTSLDPHSSYLNAKSFRDMQVQTRGEFGGLGIEVTMENGYVKVVSPIDDTPAFRAGLKPGDLITKLDNEAVQGMSLAEAVEKMRGRVNTDLILSISRDGAKPFDVTITRSVIKIQSVRSRVEGDAGYVRITSFSEQTDTGVARAMKRIREKLGDKLKGIVLDLRNNPGGLLDQSVKVSDAFLDRGEIVSTRSRRPNDSQRFNSKPGDLAKGLPIVVLINGGSASASEIVAGALQDHHRAIIMGTRSFGKGSVQTIIPIAGHGAVRLTTARYYTPSGRSIQAKGIDPDIVVEQSRIETVSAPKRRSERDLRGALANPNEKKTDKTPVKKDEKSEKTKKKPQDYQLTRALDLIRGLALFQSRTAK
ncbi:MAG: S41 family peptidase [Rhodospirillales bacterium]|nr:S41 family peptidase [Rhodospirillales bacterium]